MGVNVMARGMKELMSDGRRPLLYPPPLSRERGRPALRATFVKPHVYPLSREPEQGWEGGLCVFAFQGSCA
jgi:hypothetical protein